jgi:hypothetical protein
MATANKNLFPDLSNPNAEYYQVYKPKFDTTPTYSAPTSYSGQQSSLGNITGVSADKVNSAYTGFADSARASGTAGTGGQVNMYTAPGGNVYNTSNMTPQQINALMLNKENNPNAAAILSGMGLDINGNQKIKSPWEQGLDRLRDNYAQSTGNTYNYQTGAYTSPTGSGSSYSIPQNGGYVPPSAASAAKGVFTAPVSATGAQQNPLYEQAKAQVDQKRAAIFNAYNQQKGTLKDEYDYTQQHKNDSRILEDVAFQRNNNPFSGRTGYAQRQNQRDRGIEDTAAQKSYNSTIAGLSSQLAEFDANYPALIQEALNALEDRQFNKDTTIAGLTGNYNGQRTLAGSAQDANVQNQQFNQGIAQANVTGSYQPYQSQINQMNANSQAWFNATPEQRQQLEAQNRSIASQIGATQDAQGNWVMPQATPTLEAIKTQFENDKYWTTFQENVRQFDTTTAIEKAYKDGQLSLQQAAQAIDKYQAETSRMGTISSANTAAERLAWEKDPNNPDNIYKMNQANSAGTTRTDNNNQFTSAVVSNVDQMDPDTRKKFFTNEKQTLINQLGLSGYNTLYNQYFDQYGDPK